MSRTEPSRRVHTTFAFAFAFAFAAPAVAALALAACQASGKPPGTGGALDHDAAFVINGSHVALQCVDCHDRNAASFETATVDCVHCHADASVTPRHTGVSGYTWANAACIDCHRGGSVAFDHASFPTAPGTAHGGISCADCHGTTNAVADLKCSSCHGGAAALDGAHAGLPDYAAAPAACYGCHTDGRVPSVDHTWFPIAAGTTHGGLSCADCHGATRAKADLACTSCHSGEHARTAMDAAHAGVASYAWASPSCYDCHPRSDVGLPAGHDTNQFPVTGTSHADLTCGECHGATRAIAELRCTTCHGQAEAASQHARVPASRRGSRDGVTRPSYEWRAPSCVKCHADGQVDTVAAHPRISHGLTGEGHAPFCLTCHQATRTSGKTWAADFGVSTCLSCHSTDNPD